MITVTVKNGDHVSAYKAKEGDLLLFVLREHGIMIPAACGGTGSCGGCKVATENGAVLSCHYRLTEDITVYLKENNALEAVLMPEEKMTPSVLQETGQAYGMAVDIGTTTLGFALKDLNTGRKAGQWGCPNRQASFGADIALRILACEKEGGLKALCECIRSDIKKGMEVLEAQNGIAPEAVKEIVITGNAVMLHILQGISPSSMGKAPFTVPHPQARHLWKDGREIFLFPHASAFVGGDIIAGVQSLALRKSNDIQLFLDLGTNGEMVIGNKEKLLATATAAGPAFENCFRNTQTHGSRILELLVLNARRKIISQDGRIAEPYRQKGIPCGGGLWITQKKIREIQLAKGAIRTGIECLMELYGCTPEEVKKVYLAGGFGFYLNLSSAIKIGLIPKSFQDKVEVVGNSALRGAYEALGDLKWKEEAKKYAAGIQCCNLARLQGFQEKYLEEIAYII